MSTSSEKRAVIVGGGLGGLACAVELARVGFGVTVVDQNGHAGGKMNVLEEGGFSFDMGPTILTLPDVVRGIIRRTGRDVADYLDLVELDPQWRCMYEDGVTIDLRKDVGEMRRSLDTVFPGSGAGDGYASFVEYARRMLRLSEKVFFYKDVGGVLDMARVSPLGDPKILGDVLAMRVHATMAGTVHKHVREPHVAQMCEHYLQYVGSSPFLAPAILSLIAAAQTDHGVWYSMGGTRRVAQALARLGGEMGVEFVLGERVERIECEGDRATGVLLGNGERIEADVVVSNCDVQRTMDGLIGTPAARGRRSSIAKKYRPACSGVVLYLGLDRTYEHLAHHNFLFSKDSTREFGDIYHERIPARDPTVYLAAPSRTDPAQAPTGGEALYALIHTPALERGHEWERGEPDTSGRGVEMGPTMRGYREVILDKLGRFGMEDIRERIVVERFLSPSSIDRMYNAEGGAIYGLASHGRMRGGFKPRNRSGVAQNVYLAGGSVNPGPGVPMVLMSGVTAALCVMEDHGVDDAACVSGSAADNVHALAGASG